MTMINFLSLDQGANFYVIGTNGGLNVAVGTIKEKRGPYWPMPANGITSQLVDLTVTFNGQDKVIPGLPVNLEVAGRDPEIYTGNLELAERIIDEKAAEARTCLQNRPLYEKILADHPKCKEIVNPGFAATRQQTEAFHQLQAKYDAMEKRLQESEARNADMYQMLKEMHDGMNNAPTQKGKAEKKES